MPFIIYSPISSLPCLRIDMLYKVQWCFEKAAMETLPGGDKEQGVFTHRSYNLSMTYC